MKIGVNLNGMNFDYKAIINPNTLLWGVSIGACICFILLILIGVPVQYSALYVEPIIYILFLNLFIKPRFIIGLGTSALIFMYFVKLCILPISTVLGDFTTIVASSIYNEYWNEACFYIAVEWVIVSFSVRIIGGHYLNKISRLKSNDSESYSKKPDKEIMTFKNHPVYYLALGLFLGILTLLIIINSNLLSAIFFIWEMEDDTVAAGGGPVWFMFKNFIVWAQPLFFFWITVKIYNSKFRVGKFFTLLCLAFFSSIIMTEYRILSLIIGVTIFGFTIGKFNKFRIMSKILKIITGVFLLLTIYMLTTHGDDMNQTYANLGRLLDIYCGGFLVAAASCSVHMDDGILMFIFDTVSANPLSHLIFGDIPTTTDVINSALNASAKGIFYELMVQAKDFFGVFSPIAVGLCIFFLMKMDFYTSTEDVDLYRLFYIFCAVSVALFMVMYTYSMVTNFIIYKCLVWLIVIAVDRHVRIKA